MREASASTIPAGSVGLLGAPWDENSSFLRGPAAAPPRIRAALSSPATNSCAESGADLATEPRFVDLGDLDLGRDPLATIERAARAIGERGARPLTLGGDHAVSFPLVRGLAHVHSELTILQIDAHPDLYDELDGNRLSHACPFARILENGLARRLVQVGIRTMTPHQREQAERFGVEVFAMRDWRAVLDLAWDAPVYVSIDLDGLDPSCAPGVSHHEPGGLGVRDVLDTIWSVDAEIVGADVVELNPARDLLDMTAMVAAKLTKELAALMLA